MKISTEDFTDETLAIDDTYGDDVREIVVLVMEVDKVANEVNITNEEFFGVTLAKFIANTSGATWWPNF